MDTNVNEAFQLSPQQRQLWLAGRSETPQTIQVVVSLDGTVDAEAMQLALRRVVDRHEVLRTTFKTMTGLMVPFQVVNVSGNVGWRHVDLAAADGDEAEIDTLIQHERGHAIDWERGPILRVCQVDVDRRRHYLVLTMEPLCADAVTMELLVREIAAAYEAPDYPAAENAAVLQYADFAAWENELLEAGGAAADVGRSFWQNETVVSPPLVRLPFEADRSENRGPASIGERMFTVRKEVSAAIERSGASPAAFCLAAWGALLFRLTGSTDTSVATVMPGRKVEETRQALGLFAREIPIRCRCEPQMPFRDLVAAVEQKLREMDDWQEYFIASDGSDRDRAAEPPFGYEFIDLPQPFESRGIAWRIENIENRAGDLRLRLSVLRAGHGWTTRCQYDEALYRSDDIERYLRCYHALLRSAASDPGRAINALDLLDDVDRRQLLVDLNRTREILPAVEGVLDLFEQQAARTPDRIAVVSGAHQLTYSLLEARANQLAHYLRRQGVSEQSSVGLLVDRSVEMMVALLGILKAGATYVPLSGDHPQGRLRHQLTETGAVAVVTETRWLNALPEPAAAVVCLDRDAAAIGGEPATSPSRTTLRDDLVYVLYTSGSTGTPKGVAVTHGNLLNYTAGICRRLGLHESQEALHFATVSTITADLGNTAIFPSLVTGGCLHVIPYETSTDAEAFAEYLSTRPIDVLKIVPSHMLALMSAGNGRDVLPRRILILGGETLTWDLADKLLGRAKNCRVVNHYGPTETTVGSLTFELDSGPGRWRQTSRTVPIGRPLANTDVYILDEQLSPVPPGISGQLYIGGLGVARGYVARPDLTRERFIRNPFGDNAILYDTGDSARYLSDGTVEFLGRRDHQVKLRGFRVELGEVETALLSHSAITEAVVAVVDTDGGERQLVAYLVAHDSSTPSSEELRRALGEQLPPYMIPSSFVFLSALPLTNNGKVDRAALSRLGTTLPDAHRPFVAPRTPLEAEIAAIWAQVLKHERVGVNDNFFELGGHSLLVTQVVSRIRSRFHVELPLRTLFEFPTVAGTAVVVDQLHAAREPDGEVKPILSELEQLSDEEAARLLDAELGSAGGSDAASAHIQAGG